MEYPYPHLKEKSIENIKKEIDTIEKKISLIHHRIKDNNIDPITLEEIKNPVITKCCHNKFDMTSIIRTLDHTSRYPLCRESLNEHNLIAISSSSSELDSPVSKKYDKYEQLDILLKNNLVTTVNFNFSQYNENFLKLKEY